jgi:hypothetical protein
MVSEEVSREQKCFLFLFSGIHFYLSFFARPKKDQKKTPEIDIQPDFGGSYVQLMYKVNSTFKIHTYLLHQLV